MFSGRRFVGYRRQALVACITRTMNHDPYHFMLKHSQDKTGMSGDIQYRYTHPTAQTNNTRTTINYERSI